jgi:hypothetical protein
MAKKLPKRWWTLAWLDREGQLGAEIARSRKPKFYVWQDGHVQTLE